MTNTPLPPCTILVRLSREWEVLRHRPAAVRRAAGWGLGIDVTSLDDVLAACGMARSAAERSAAVPAATAGSAANDVLVQLVLVARRDDLAARVVLQRLLPGLLAAARRWGQRLGGVDGREAFDELVAAAWTVIRTHPVERRSVHLAAQLLRGAEYHAFVRAGRRMLVVEPTATQRLDRASLDDEVTDPAAELDAIVSAASLTDHDRLLLELLRAGRPVGEVAVALQVSERTVRNHRDAMLSRLRQAAYALAAA